MATEAMYLEVVEPERPVVTEAPRDDGHEGAVSTVSRTDLDGRRAGMVFHTTMQTTDELRGNAGPGLERRSTASPSTRPDQGHHSKGAT
jgi:uncharacterized protein YndB with AHSA1/START domain